MSFKPFTIAKYETKGIFREFRAIGFMIILPIAVVGTMAALSPDRTKLSYTIAGNMCMIMLFVLSMGTASNLIEKRENGTLRRLFIMPIRKNTFLEGMSIVGLVEIAVMTSIMIALLLIFGVTIKGSWANLGLVIVLFALFTISFGVIISAVAKSFHTAILVCMSVILPMSATSGAWMPVKTVETQIGEYVKINPMYHALRAMDAIITEGEDLPHSSSDLAILGLFTIILFIIGVVLYSKMVEV